MKTFLYTLLATVLFCCEMPYRAAANQEDVTAQLLNRRWVLSTVYGAEIEKQEKDVYITFKRGGSIDGFSGCNTFSGGYSANKKSFDITDITITKMACDKTDLEKKILSAMEEANDFYISGEELQLFNKGQMIASFNAVYMK